MLYKTYACSYTCYDHQKILIITSLNLFHIKFIYTLDFITY